MSDRRVGIDIGASAVRVVEISGLNDDSYAQVTKVAVVPLQAGAVTSGRITDPTAVAWTLRAALKAARVSPYGPVLGIASPETAIARVLIPEAVAPGEWAGTLRTLNADISPKTPIGSSSLSLYRAGEPVVVNDAMSTSLLAGAVLTEQVEQMMAVCRLAKVTPRAIDLAGAAAMRCLTRAVPMNEEVATLVDIGASKTTVVTRQGLHLRSLWTLDIGGDAVTRAIMGVTGMPYAAAEDLKLGMRLLEAEASSRQAKAAAVASAYGTLDESQVNDVDTSSAAQDAMTGAADRLIDEIAAAIETDSHRNPANPTQGLLLCGGTALMRGLKDRIIKRVGVPAVVGRPWATVQESRRTAYLLVDGTEDPVALLGLTTAVGLAMWKEPT